MSFILLAALALLGIKVFADLTSRFLPLPFFSMLAGAGIIYPAVLALFVYEFFRNPVWAGAIIAVSVILLLVGGVRLI